VAVSEVLIAGCEDVQEAIFKRIEGLGADNPLELVKTSGSSHCGEHSAAVKMEA
jgi:hypothetical protein